MMILKRSECAILSLVLTRKWYEMIERGEKLEEYRLATEYWQKRMWNWNLAFRPKTVPVVEFRLGYAKNARRMAFWTMGLNTHCGMLPYAFVAADDAGNTIHPQWGEPENAHFVIRLGGRVELTKESEPAK